MADHRLPPIYDAVRLWGKSGPETLRACVAFRKRQPPGWTLAFLRNKAPYIFSGEIKESALRQAVRKYVPSESQRSVFEGLDLLLRFIKKHKWQGKQLSGCDLVYEGLATQLQPIGAYYSESLKRKFVLGLQPRLENIPTDEQFRIWLSALHYQYCIGRSEPLGAMIVDLSKSTVNGKRELRELTSKKIPLLSIDEMNERMTLVGLSYNQAIKVVPELPSRPTPKISPAQRKLI